ncbi:MAG: HAD-IIB family hydrolase [Cellvibrionaceae bacterium]
MTEFPLLIYSDLDGTLLDHDSYDFSAAMPMLKRLNQCQIETVLCTSKTFLEVVHLREQLSNHDPFIVENGAAVYLPKARFSVPPAGATSVSSYWRYAFCPPRDHWLQLIDHNRLGFDHCFEQFSTMTRDRVVALTGLSDSEAERAQAREFGEPLHWLGSDEELTEFCRTLVAQGASVLTGGRFVHICGQADKGAAMTWLTQLLETQSGQSKITIGLGDSQNDVAMLEACDYAVVVKSPAKGFPTLQRKDKLYFSQAFGPQGWVEGLEYHFRQIHLPELHRLLEEDNSCG